MSFANIPRPRKGESKIAVTLPQLSEIDRVLLTELLGLLSSELIGFYSNHDFNGAFPSRVWSPLSDFVDGWGDVNHEFVDDDLEAYKKRLYLEANKLASLIARYTVSLDKDYRSVKPRGGGFTEEERERFRNEAKEINAQCDPFVSECNTFVRYARKRL